MNLSPFPSLEGKVNFEHKTNEITIISNTLNLWIQHMKRLTEAQTGLDIRGFVLRPFGQQGHGTCSQKEGRVTPQLKPATARHALTQEICSNETD